MNGFHPHDSNIKYVQDYYNTSFLSKLSPALYESREYVAYRAIV